jgi:xanthine dehydrogenase accessory factor
MPDSPYHRMAALAAAGVRFAVATVVRTHGSTPQIAGAKLTVTTDSAERPAGTLGGGCVEADAIEALRQILSTGGSALREYQLTEELAWNTGLVCGGTMEILAEAGDAATTCDGRNVLPEAVEAAAGGRPMAFVTEVGKRGPTAKLITRAAVLADGRLVGTFNDRAQNERARDLAIDQMRHGTPRLVSFSDVSDVLIEPVTSKPHLVIAGGGHVAKAIAHQAKLLDFDVTVLEDRPEFADPERFGGARVIDGDVPSSIAAYRFTPLTYLVVATRGHKLDADCVLAAARTTVPYVGLLGSRRKTVLIEDMLRDEGIPDARLAAIHAPVGLDLGGRTPAEIALSVMAEISQMRHGGTGKPLRQRR